MQRFGRDLPSAMPRPYQQRPIKWLILSALALIILVFTLFAKSEPTVSTTGNEVGSTMNNLHDSDTLTNEDLQNQDTKYVIIIDAGSSGSRIHVHPFTWKDKSALPEIHASVYTKKVKPGLSSRALHPDLAGGDITKLVLEAKEYMTRSTTEEKPGLGLPLSALPHIQIHLQATAGLRSILPEQAEAVLDSVRDALSKTGFSFKRQWARIISGQEEGVFGWLCANYLAGALSSEDTIPTNGIAELGGASMQLTYVPMVSLANPIDDSKLVQIKVLAREWKLYTHSYLGWGLEAVQEKHQHTAAIVDAVDLEGNPCYPRGYHFSSNGNWTNCYRWLESVVPHPTTVKCTWSSCGIDTIYQPAIVAEPFFAIENFYYTSKYFGVHESERFLKGLKEAGEVFCSRTWMDIISENEQLPVDKRADISDLVKYCFSSAYAVRVLEVGFGMKEDTPLVVKKDVLPQRGIDWALGSVLDILVGGTIRRIPNGDDNDRLERVVTNGAGVPRSGSLIWLSIAAVAAMAIYIIAKQCVHRKTNVLPR